MDVPEARRVASPSWLNARTALGLLLFCAAVLGGQHLIQRSAAMTLVWAAAHDLPQDTQLSAGDLSLVEVRLPAQAEAGYVPGSVAIEGRILARPVLAGELLHGGWLVDTAAAGEARTMTIPVAPEHAVGGSLRGGDRVDIYATFDPGDARARTTLLARDIEVVEVMTAGGFALDEDTVVGLTLAVSADEAARLAFAVRAGEIDVVRVTPGTAPARSQTVRAGDFP